MVSGPVCGETHVPRETTGDSVAPCTLSSDISVGRSALTGTSRSQRALLSPPVLPLRLWEEPGFGVPAGFLDRKMSRPAQGSCLSQGCSVRTKLTLTVQAGATGLRTVTQVGTGPGYQGSAPSLISPWGADSGTLSCSSCPVSPVSVSAGSLSQPLLTQPASLSGSPGASARLTCTLSSGYSVVSYTIYWYQQKAGSPPRYLLRFKSDSDKHQGSGVPSHFSGSKDASTNAGLLLISGLQPEDEANYHCAVWHDDTNAHTVLQSSEEVRQKPPPLTPARGSDEVELRGSWAQALLTQPPSVSRTLGQRITLSRTGSSSNTGVIM
ncbi:hypothetical protein MJG53_014629 [Ovis ammon polii x Ovis aries]|uniref:Uncharacterized protein n=1 Tax=Ovis ammon polii x Ovis aries TaxID=2918886 RepID=A0ACB9UGX1_9CETA|nr:hypothetical protein MJG53_014629 [Ovis ammon polii x Ovis aries]